MKKTFWAAVLLLCFCSAQAQYDYHDSNRIGIIGGVNQFQLNTSNFDTKALMGWNLGLSVRGNWYNDFDMVYGIQFSENKFSVPTRDAITLQREEVEYKLPSAQISLMLSYKIVENHLSVEVGPMLQINDKFKIDDDKHLTNIIDNTVLEAGDIVKAQRFNFYPVVGLTAGVRHFRANVQYAYGVTNILSKLDDANPGMKFKGNAGILSGNLIIYL